MEDFQLNKGNELRSKIETIKKHIIEVKRGRVTFLNRVEDGVNCMRGFSVDFNEFLPDEKPVRDAYLKNVSAELVRMEKEYAAL